MKETGITIGGIQERLYSLDTEYREALAKALMELNYVSASPLRLSLGTESQQQELRDVYERPLKAKELREIVEFMSKEMEGDFQYNRFKGLASYYLRIADQYLDKEKDTLNTKKDNDLER